MRMPLSVWALFIAALFSPGPALDAAISMATSRWGSLDYQSKDQPFDVTDYYESEMRPGLLRRIVTFDRLVSPQILPRAKHECIEIESAHRADGKRRVNFDVGYLDHNKIVLASTKPAGQKIYLADGIWADIQGRYAKGRYAPFDWTFPDFADGRYDEDLALIRAAYLEQLRDTG